MLTRWHLTIWVLWVTLAVCCQPVASQGDCFTSSNASLQLVQSNATTSCDSMCRANTLNALSSIYIQLNGPRWSHVSHEHNQSWDPNSCQPLCSAGAVGLDGVGSTPTHRLPSYCCWSGVTCCKQLPGSSNDVVEPCKPYSVIGLSLKARNLAGRFADILPALKVLHDYGLHEVIMTSNNLTGSLPREIGELTDLRELVLGDNRE